MKENHVTTEKQKHPTYNVQTGTEGTESLPGLFWLTKGLASHRGKPSVPSVPTQSTTIFIRTINILGVQKGHTKPSVPTEGVSR
jgi:hypothetical protein